jgi:hypothetical protein
MPKKRYAAVMADKKLLKAEMVQARRIIAKRNRQISKLISFAKKKDNLIPLLLSIRQMEKDTGITVEQLGILLHADTVNTFRRQNFNPKILNGLIKKEFIGRLGNKGNHLYFIKPKGKLILLKIGEVISSIISNLIKQIK